MEKAYLSEAFRQLDLLNEEDFNLSTTDGSEMKNFLDDNEDISVMSLDVIDPEAESEEDLEDSYTGKVILDCCVCHSKLYKDKEEVTVDEEQDLANTDEECPFCYSRDGFKIIGEVAPYGESEEEPEIEDEEHEDMDESFRTELIPNNGRKSFYGKAVVDTLDDGSQVLYSYNTPIIKKYPNGELKRLYDGWSATTGRHIKAFCGLDKKGFLNLEYEKFDESLKTRKNRKLKESYGNSNYYDIVDLYAELVSEDLEYEPNGDMYDFILEVINSNFIYYDDQWTVLRYLGENPLEYFTDDMWEEFCNDLASKVEVPEDDDETNESLKTGKNKRLKESVKNGYRGSKDIEFVWKGQWSDPELVYDGKTFNYWDIEDALWNMFLEENPQWEDSDSDNPECEDEFNRYVQSEGTLYLDDVIAGGYFEESLKSRKNKSVNESEDGRKLFTEYKILVDGRTYEISHTKQRADEIVPILKDMYPDSEIEAKPYKHYASGIERKRLERQIADQLKEYGVTESVNESIQEIEIETDTDKIKIESEPKEESGEDVLAPVSPETEDEIMSNGEEDEVDIPLDDFDEETFDELGESFLKGTYENVKGYKTESVKEQDDNKLVVEGLITFNSGKVKKTSFIFEAKDITKSGKVRFIGENCQLSRGKKSFTVAGKIQEGKFISESLNYNYRAKDAKSGKSTRMYGTVRTNK